MTELAATEPRVSAAGFDSGATGVTPPSNPNRRGVFLADVVVELGLADQETIDRAAQAAQETEQSLERYLLDAGILDEESLSLAMAERSGLDHVDLGEFEVDMEAAQMVARSAAERYSAVPVAFASDGALIVAVQDPFDTLGISDIEVMTRSSVRPAIATAAGIDSLIERLPEQPVSRPPVEEEVDLGTNGHEDVDPGTNGHVDATDLIEMDVEVPVPEAEAEAESEPPFESLVEPEPEPPVEVEVESEPILEVEPVSTFEPFVQVEPEPDPVAEVDPEPEPGLELVEVPEPEPQLEVVLDQGPELVQFPEPEPEDDPEPAASAGGVTDLQSELGSLQETARRADELAATVERRITELKSADERSAQLEADLDAAQRRIDELEGQVSGVDTLAEELRATTAKLEEVNRVLEGSVG